MFNRSVEHGVHVGRLQTELLAQRMTPQREHARTAPTFTKTQHCDPGELLTGSGADEHLGLVPVAGEGQPGCGAAHVTHSAPAKPDPAVMKPGHEGDVSPGRAWFVRFMDCILTSSATNINHLGRSVYPLPSLFRFARSSLASGGIRSSHQNTIIGGGVTHV
jgi:hypothetical protein